MANERDTQAELDRASEALAKRGAAGRFAREVFDSIVDPNSIAGSKPFRSEGQIHGRVLGENEAREYGISIDCPEGYPIKIRITNTFRAIEPNSGISSTDRLVFIEFDAHSESEFSASAKFWGYEIKLDSPFELWTLKQLNSIAERLATFKSQTPDQS